MAILGQDIEIKGKVTEHLCFNIETYCQEGNKQKGVSRVVLVNELGQRVLDTQIKIVNPAISQRKQQGFLLKQWAQDRAPEAQLVRRAILALSKGSKIVGYHVSQKLKEFQILEQM